MFVCNLSDGQLAHLWSARHLRSALLSFLLRRVSIFCLGFLDTVVMNPPSGIRRKGADIDSLSAALYIAPEAVYSLHKTSTRDVSGFFDVSRHKQ
ncbi:hypothetical protein NC652_016881 [Populus alba x Populus x berolinensis]|nr:hypothetical protein NC652_016881 [Populus alba x Populus x berolinensis]